MMKTKPTNNINSNNSEGDNSMKTKPLTNNNEGESNMTSKPATTNPGDNSMKNVTDHTTNINSNEGDSDMTSKPETNDKNKGVENMTDQIANDYDKTTSNGTSNIASIINDAEEFKNPLDDLPERCANDVGTAFEPESIEMLANLKKEDLARFMSLRERLKKAGCALRELDAAIKAQGGDDGHSPSQTDLLINFTEDEGVELFHTEEKEAYADVNNGDRRETYNVRSKGFQRWLRGRFFQETNSAPTADSLQNALGTIEAKAIYQGQKRKVFLRIAPTPDGKIYLDLGGDDWRCVEVDKAGWRVVNEPPVRFRRTAGMQELPVPQPGGSIDDLKTFLNVGNDADFVLVVSWLLAGLRGQGPYPVIVLSGEQGSAKSTFSNILRSLLDPNKSPARALPRENRDLFIAANNAYILAFDNVSNLHDWISDSLCRITHGGSFATRELHTDQDEILFEAARPIMLNGIEDIVTRADLADRALFFTLEAIPEDRRRSEAELWREFEKKRPYILGTLLDAVVKGLNRIDEVKLPTLPRMADFAEWGVACETALWDSGTFWNAYDRNRKDVVENVIDGDPVANAICSLIAERNEWSGTATELLGAIEGKVGERVSKSKNFPKSPRALSGRLTRAASFLRKMGIEIERDRQGKSAKRIIHIKADTNLFGSSVAGKFASASSVSSASSPSADATDEMDAKLRTMPCQSIRDKTDNTPSNPDDDKNDSEDDDERYFKQ